MPVQIMPVSGLLNAAHWYDGRPVRVRGTFRYVGPPPPLACARSPSTGATFLLDVYRPHSSSWGLPHGGGRRLAVLHAGPDGDAVDWAHLPRYANGQTVLVLGVARVVPVVDPCNPDRLFRSVYLAVDPATLPLVPAPIGAAAAGTRP